VQLQARRTFFFFDFDFAMSEESKLFGSLKSKEFVGHKKKVKSKQWNAFASKSDSHFERLMELRGMPQESDWLQSPQMKQYECGH
jgi:hypothetical protein